MPQCGLVENTYSYSWGKMFLHLQWVLLIHMLAKGPLCSRCFFLSGTFGKALRRPHLDAYSSFGQPSDCQPRAFYLKAHSSPDLDSGSEEDGKERTDFQEDNHICTFKQTLENYRTPNFQSYDLDT